IALPALPGGAHGVHRRELVALVSTRRQEPRARPRESAATAARRDAPPLLRRPARTLSRRLRRQRRGHPRRHRRVRRRRAVARVRELRAAPALRGPARRAGGEAHGFDGAAHGPGDLVPAALLAGGACAEGQAARVSRVWRGLPRLMAGRRGRTERPRVERLRLGQWSRVALLVSSTALTFALARIQILASDQYALIAKENRVRPIVVPAPRGTIYDRYGQVVAENTVGYQVLLMPAPMDSMLAQLARLRPVLGLTDREIALALARYRREPHLPMQVTANASPGGVARLQERRFLFPGVLIHQYPRRHYPAGAAVAHLAGYVAEISSAELELPEFAGYRQGRWIGKAGLERSYEHVIGGEPGVRYLEVDALGRIKRWLPEESGLPPIPGRDLTLYLDLDLQRYIMEIFPKGMRGAFVALDPQTG